LSNIKRKSFIPFWFMIIFFEFFSHAEVAVGELKEF